MLNALGSILSTLSKQILYWVDREGKIPDLNNQNQLIEMCQEK